MSQLQIYNILKVHPDLTVTELHQKMGGNKGTMRNKLYRMCKNGRVSKTPIAGTRAFTYNIQE